MLTPTNISDMPARSGIEDFLSTDRTLGTLRGESARFAHVIPA